MHKFVSLRYKNFSVTAWPVIVYEGFILITVADPPKGRSNNVTNRTIRVQLQTEQHIDHISQPTRERDVEYLHPAVVAGLSARRKFLGVATKETERLERPEEDFELVSGPKAVGRFPCSSARVASRVGRHKQIQNGAAVVRPTLAYKPLKAEAQGENEHRLVFSHQGPPQVRQERSPPTGKVLQDL